jgi:hypothetical protein
MRPEDIDRFWTATIKALHVYPDLTHSACTGFNVHAMHWLRRYPGGWTGQPTGGNHNACP